jgi:hypothetical protein
MPTHIHPFPTKGDVLKSTSRFNPRRQSPPSLAGCASPALDFGALEPADCGEKQQEIAERPQSGPRAQRCWPFRISFSAERILGVV